MFSLDNAYAQVKDGWLEGERLENGVKVFRGIPYAAPPVGQLRWKPPAPPAEWVGLRKSIYFGCEAVQENYNDCRGMPQGAYEQWMASTPPLSEDCLYLNVWTPAETAKEKLPVYVWIHGGSLQIGAGSNHLYDSAALAEKRIVVVTINYRMGIFGFFAHPALSQESGSNASGNYGLLDQIMAIRWVKENIMGFGGDPDNITVGGQSAGALSVDAILASPLAKGLFQRATIQSGPAFGLREYFIPLKDAEAEGLQFMTAIGTGTIAAMREMPPWELFGRSREQQFSPKIVIDGWLLPDDPGAVILAGKHNRAAILLGCTSDELSDRYSPENGLEEEEYIRKVRHDFGEHAQILLDLYPPGKPSFTARSDIRLVADSWFAGTRLMAKFASRYGPDVYLYYFTRSMSGIHGDFYGANHSAELPFLFHLVDKGAIFPWDDRTWEAFDYQYSDRIMTFWSNFMKTGNPNGKNLPEWPQYDAAADQVMEFGETMHTVAVPRKKQLEVLEHVHCKFL